ncbi:organoarsenical effux MFS transporter ArsJ [Halothiobacillus sp. DCM-1]|uniref:organoarsenical effux MFS transporter ArsJ n=1 Tax=Halothiobacillus sp. DCM-1 TaxID=3112558 RepID=UPI003253C545
MNPALRQYAVVTGNYWAFTLTDGAIRMLVVLHFYQLGYSPFAIAMLFVFYEVFGILTNLVGGWFGARLGLNRTMQMGTALQIFALLMLTVPAAWLTVPYVMTAQALSGVAKDLNKMSAKAGVKLIAGAQEDRLFSWVAWITGSKNALKGLGFFLGALLLALLGFAGANAALALMLLIGFLATLTLPAGLGAIPGKTKFRQLFAQEPAINWLAAARLFLFGARDVWFVVALPVYLVSIGWSFEWVGAYLALWVVGYGMVQAAAPTFFRRRQQAPDATAALWWTLSLVGTPVLIAAALWLGWPPGWVVTLGLIVFGGLFALNSALHSYLILRYSDFDKASLNVGFYYAANAGGRLLGTVLSGYSYQQIGFIGCLLVSAGFLMLAAVFTQQMSRLMVGAKG